MTKSKARERIAKLRVSIGRHRYLYHVHDRQEISDAALDSLKHELKKLEDEFPDLVTPDSPTQRVGGAPLAAFTKTQHHPPMLSLEDVFSEEEFLEWAGRIAKISEDGRLGGFFGEIKFDGIAVSLKYRNGILQEGSTRGDGAIGEDVTQNIKTIESIPLSLELHAPNALYRRFPDAARIIKNGEIEVRGEVIITKEGFLHINKEQMRRQAEGDKNARLYANPRNLAAGSIRQLDPAVARSRRLVFFAYGLVTAMGQKTHADDHRLLEAFGFKTDRTARVLQTPNGVFAYKTEIEHRREALPYHIDGLVVTVNETALFTRLGVAGKAPRGSVAFKFAPLEATTRVLAIRVQVGRTGALTPVAHLEPVQIGGVTISRATLHNEDEIKRLDIKIGDTVVVGRAGDVIPDVRAVLKDLRTGAEKTFRMPRVCPVCGGSAARNKGEAAYRCGNTECPALKRKGIYHFVSKKAFDIDGLGPKIIDALLDQNLIQDAGDIFDLTEGDLAPLERFGEKSASNLMRAIQERKEIPLARFLVALGILHLGEELAESFAERLARADDSHTAPVGAVWRVRDLAARAEMVARAQLEAIPDIGPKVAQSIYSWFHTKHNKLLLDKLDKAGVTVLVPAMHGSGLKLYGKTFVFTGELAHMTRREAKDAVRTFGGTVSETVSKKTDYVVAGTEPGSKYKKAKKLELRIVDEDEFLKLINA